MDTLLSGIADNIGQFAALMFSADGLPIWTSLLVPAALAAAPLLVIRPAAASATTRIGRVVVACLPAFWLAICAIVVAFARNEKFGRADFGEIAFWVFVGLGGLMTLSGLTAMVMIKGWHRLTAVALLSVNLWITAGCAFYGIMLVSGVFI